MPTDGQTPDGRRLDGYTISSPCEPYGSGELKDLYEDVLHHLRSSTMHADQPLLLTAAKITEFL